MPSTVELPPEWSDPDRAEGALERLANDALLTPRGPAPARRQLEVLQEMSMGLSYAETAAALGISIETVKEHMKRVRERLGARNTNQAIAEALRRGLIA